VNIYTAIKPVGEAARGWGKEKVGRYEGGKVKTVEGERGKVRRGGSPLISQSLTDECFFWKLGAVVKSPLQSTL
jgi:hypothetical protein